MNWESNSHDLKAVNRNRWRYQLAYRWIYMLWIHTLLSVDIHERFTMIDETCAVMVGWSRCIITEQPVSLGNGAFYRPVPMCQIYAFRKETINYNILAPWHVRSNLHNLCNYVDFFCFYNEDSNLIIWIWLYVTMYQVYEL